MSDDLVVSCLARVWSNVSMLVLLSVGEGVVCILCGEDPSMSASEIFIRPVSRKIVPSTDFIGHSS